MYSYTFVSKAPDLIFALRGALKQHGIPRDQMLQALSWAFGEDWIDAAPFTLPRRWNHFNLKLKRNLEDLWISATMFEAGYVIAQGYLNSEDRTIPSFEWTGDEMKRSKSSYTQIGPKRAYIKKEG